MLDGPPHQVAIGRIYVFLLHSKIFEQGDKPYLTKDNERCVIFPTKKICDELGTSILGTLDYIGFSPFLDACIFWPNRKRHDLLNECNMTRKFRNEIIYIQDETPTYRCTKHYLE